MMPYAVIRQKRDGGAVPRPLLDSFLQAFHHGDLPDYQMAAFLMAVWFRGLDATELDVLVDAIIDSGSRVDFGAEPGRRIDKHSTGGVGDKVSIVLAPLAAALGVQVPMMTGRGLGHSGGTVDKLSAIPGFRLDLPLDTFRDQVLDLGVAMISQTPEITPLDGRLYALRDVTATVDSIPLIASSIMSKKLASGIDGLVLDVKTGNGAFMTAEADALELARTMIGIGAQRDCDVVALVTAMDRPLGRAVGNALEVVEAIDLLRGEGPADVREVTVALTAEMLVLAAAAPDIEAGRAAAEAALDDGRALDRFRRLVEVQGGDPRVVDSPADTLPRAPVQRTVGAAAAGRVVAMDTRAIGEAAVALGAGRRHTDDLIDPRVGFELQVEPGTRLERGDPVAVIHAADHEVAARAEAALRDAITVGDDTPRPRPLISHRVTRTGVEEVGPGR
jgi:pyrimidine-nucleoside phosphorylase